MGLFDWLFPKSTRTSPPASNAEIPIRIDATLDLTPKHEPRRRSRKAKESRVFALVESDFDPDGAASDLMWYGFHIHDENGLGVTYDEAVDFNLHIFNVAGVSFRADALQRIEFKPGEIVLLRREENNQYDKNAVAVWDALGRHHVGYVPRDRNRRIRTVLKNADYSAIVLAEKRRDGKRVSLTVMLGPMNMRRQ